MPKVSPIQPNFNCGEFSPALYGRVDSERYKAGLATCLNYLPILQGPLIRRPGSKYVNNAKLLTSSSALIPFLFSSNQNYMLEFGQKYIRFYANNGQVVVNSNYFQVTGANTAALSFYYSGIRPTYTPRTGYTISGSSLSPAGVMELQSPYEAIDVNQIRWAQKGDTIYLAHPRYPIFKLQRYDTYDWQISQVYLQDGPYLPLNSYRTVGDSTQITLTTAATTGQTTLSTGSSLLVTNIIQGSTGYARVTVSSPYQSPPYSTAAPITLVGAVGSGPAFALGTGAVNTYSLSNSSAPRSWQIQPLTTTMFELIGCSFSGTYTGSGIVRPALFEIKDVNREVALIASDGQRYWGFITDNFDASTVGFSIDYHIAPADHNVRLLWQMGCYYGQTGGSSLALFGGGNDINNYPATSCFHQDRLVFAGSPAFPQQIDGSYVAEYENFQANGQIGTGALTVTAADSYQYNLTSSEENSLRWLKSSAQGLLAGSYTSEWNVTPGSQADAITPTSVNAQQTSFFGTDNIDAVQAGNATLYVQRSGKKLREMNYFFQVGTFRSTDLSELSDHITLPRLTKLAVQKETYPLVWGVRGDGNLVSMSYNRDDTTIKAGWARHILGGQSDAGGTQPIVQSIGVMPDPSTLYDQLWMIVQRSTASGSSYMSVEYMTRPFDDSFLQKDAFQLDCGATYDNPMAIVPVPADFSNGIDWIPPYLQVGCPAHGLVTGDTIRINDVVGVNIITTDVDGNSTTTNLLNGKTFTVHVDFPDIFLLMDFSGNYISAAGYSSYVSGGNVRKLVQTISGLGWLNNETVGVLADGAIHQDVVVQSSAITLNYRAGVVQIGYRYNSDGKLLRPEAGSANGSSIGKTRRPSRAAFQFHRIGDFSMGTDFNKLIPLQIPRADVQQADQAPELFSGIYRDGIESAYDFEGQICFRQNSPLPGMVQSVTVIMEEEDV